MPRFRLVALALVTACGLSVAEEGPFDARTKDHKAALTAGGGSTGKESTEEAVIAGLRWLARHQSANGSWSSSGFQKLCPEKTPCAGTGTGQFDTGLTALVLLAFAGAGKTDLDKEEYVDPVTGRTMCFGKTVHDGLTWLMESQAPDGCFDKNKGAQYMYNHMVAAAAMAEVFAMTRNAAWEKSARSGLSFTLAAQNPGRGWRYASRDGGSDTSATAWGVTSLMAARAAGFEIDKKAFEDAIAWVDSATDEKTFKVGYTGKGTGKVMMMGKNDKFDDHPTMTGAGLVIRIGSGAKKTDAVISGGEKVLLADVPKNLPLKIDYYYWYYGTEALFLSDGPSGGIWTQWNTAMKAALVPAQATKKEGCLQGSWDPAVDRWSYDVGRIFSTAINVLTLEVYYRVRPAYVKGK